MAVCTNKFEAPTLQILKALDLMQFFDDIAGADTFDVRKPDPGHVTQLVARMGASLRHAVMVGDSMHDVHAGHGLTYENVQPVATIPEIEELNIGHSIVSRALLTGMQSAVSDMADILRRARSHA